MKILVIGSGGREHALIWKLKQSPFVDEIFCAPGNGGTAGIATNIAISGTEIEKLKEWATVHQIDLTVVGPEAPLSLGIANLFQSAGLSIFGVNQQAAHLESSKLFTKRLLQKYKIPTADFDIFEDPVQAVSALKSARFPIVIKADGLAAGKGVRVCYHRQEALKAIDDFMVKKIFGVSSEKIVIETFLAGKELSYIGLVDGKIFLPFQSCQDYKKISEGDEGANTGGMGAISPSPIFNASLELKIERRIVEPLLSAFRSEAILCRGVLYIGLMIVKGDPYVLEFNVRFGDPETQVLLVRLSSDLLPYLIATIEGGLEKLPKPVWDVDPAVCVVMASRGYPESYETGFEILGLDPSFCWDDSETALFHAGTVLKGEKLLTAGGRVLNVVARGETLEKAVEQAYAAVSRIHWKNSYFRKDIGRCL